MGTHGAWNRLREGARGARLRSVLTLILALGLGACAKVSLKDTARPSATASSSAGAAATGDGATTPTIALAPEFLAALADHRAFVPASFDLKSPLPFEPKGKPLRGLIITLDAGHGGSSHSPGYAGSSRGRNSRVVEGDINMLVTAQLRHHLISAGAEVHMTRWDDRKVTVGATGRAEELGARTAVADRTASHLFLSLHHNAVDVPGPDRVVIFFHPKDKQGRRQPLETAFAVALTDELERMIPHKQKFNHLTNDPHPLVTFSDVPSAIIEFGFITNPDFDRWVSQRGAHRVEAVAAYNGVVKMWMQHARALEEQRQRLFPGAGLSKVLREELDGGGSYDDRQLKSVARSLLSAGSRLETPAQANRFLAVYRRNILSDATTFHLRAEVDDVTTTAGTVWVVRGATNQKRIRDAVPALLRAAGAPEIRNEIRLLPARELGERRFALVRIPMALTWGEPREGASVQSQVLLGDALHLLDVNEDQTFYLAMDEVGYVAWVRVDALRFVNEQEFGEWTRAPRARVTRDTMVDDFRIPTGASLPLVGAGTVVDGKVSLRIPAGVRATGRDPEISIPTKALRMPSAVSPGDVATSAGLEFLTVPYVFGGRSRLGLDCSGLTGVAWTAAGLQLPRDANQQAIVGRLVATPWNLSGLRRGDLLSFIDERGKILHIGISLGGKRFLHSSPPEVQITSLDPKDPLYSKTWAEAFAFGRRPAE